MIALMFPTVNVEQFGLYPEIEFQLKRLQKFEFQDSWHTRGFYQRAAALYHHARETPLKKVFWVAMPSRR